MPNRLRSVAGHTRAYVHARSHTHTHTPGSLGVPVSVCHCLALFTAFLAKDAPVLVGEGSEPRVPRDRKGRVQKKPFLKWICGLVILINSDPFCSF